MVGETWPKRTASDEGGGEEGAVLVALLEEGKGVGENIVGEEQELVEG